jgi:ubiquinone/menaquinone biosynthesis C-methylase UbiE
MTEAASRSADEQHSQRAIGLHTAWADRYAELYQQGSADPYRDVFTYGRHLVDLALDEYLPADGAGLRVLDVGCGTGHQLAALRSRGYEGAGVDASEAMLAYARENNPGAEIRNASVDALPFETESFDVVVCIEVLRHLRDPRPAIGEMARVLKPGGIALATAAPVLNLNLYALVNQLTSRYRIGNLRQLKQFFTTSRRVRRQFSAAGFDQVTVHGVGIGPWSWIERVAPTKTPGLLRRWERTDRAVADAPVVRELANAYVIRAVRRSA